MTPTDQAVDLSVVIVSWNTRDHLDRCLRSVMDESKRVRAGFQILVVDNGSSDGTVELLTERFPEVTILPQQTNLGFAAATNVGIRHSSGQALLLLNPDTEMRPGALEIMLSGLQSMPHVGLVSGVLLNPDGSLQSTGYRFPGLVQSVLDFFPIHPRVVTSGFNGRVSAGDRVSPYAVDHPLGACMLVRREVVEQVGLLDERYFMYSEEIDFCHRIRRAGWTILITPRAQIVHYGGQSTRQMPTEMFQELHRSRARYLRQYRSARLLRSVEITARLAAWLTEQRTQKRTSVSGDAIQRVHGLRAAARIYGQARRSDD